MHINENQSVSTLDIGTTPKDKIIGLSIRLKNENIASGWKLIGTTFGYHAVNAICITILILIVAINWSAASKGQVLEVATIIKFFGIYAVVLGIWAVFHQRLFENTVYFLGALLVYFTILQFLSNSMYGSLAQLAIICLFQFCLIAMVTTLITVINDKKGISLVSFIK